MPDLACAFAKLLEKAVKSTALKFDNVSRTRIAEVCQYESYLKESAAKYKIDPLLLLSIAWKESGFNAKAISKSGYCCGLLQVNTKVHKSYTCKDLISSSRKSIDEGARILAAFRNDNRCKASDQHLLQCYNGGFKGRNSKEAIAYARSVIKFYKLLRRNLQ